MKTYSVVLDDGARDERATIAAEVPWGVAKDTMILMLSPFLGAECETCAANAFEALKQLGAAEPGDFEAEIDGDDYRIIEDKEP